MKKTYKLENLCCANCAAKIEDKINKLPEITSAQVNFLMQKITIEAPDDKFEEALLNAEKVCKKVEPDCVIVK